ncbi:MAG TPA: NADH-quinone oxidoreductase subunit M [Candidatus Limnocylindria bacterium]|jgi:NADH-quinone oxidoreductase subunit M|nr:NADH-quinone oxidoreductase subunit M [Candidatus Limnocylindria bacterium]
MSLLNYIILTPIITALAILLIPANYQFVIRCAALLGSLITACFGLLAFFLFKAGLPGYQFESKIEWVKLGGININYHVGADGIAIGLIMAAAVVGFCAVAVSWKIEKQSKMFYILLLSMITGAVGAFASLDLFAFYFFNELALVPTFITIGVWGRGEDRSYAAFKITLYLTLGALVALVGLIVLYVKGGAQSLDIVDLHAAIAKTPLSPAAQAIIFPCLLFGFGTLVGLFPFHSWAPSGYGCAPSATAMMHAGILKKAGLFALLRVALPLMPEGVARWMPVLAILCVGNLLYCGFVAMRQRDLNLLIGNSSLAHMGFAFLGIASVSVIGITGTVLVMVAHAFLAALSFAISGWISQDTGTLDMGKLGGLLKRMPFIGSVMIICFLAGCGVPGFANFAGEVTVLFGAWKTFHWVVAAAAWGGLVIGGVYMLRAIRSVLHGELRSEWADAHDASSFWRQAPYAILVLALLVFGFVPNLLSDRVKPVAAEIVKQATLKAATPVAAATAKVAAQP